MLVFAVRRLLSVIPILLAASIFTFLLVDTYGDPLAPMRMQVPPVPEQTIQLTAERLYLDRSTPERYWLWLTGVGDTHGDIGLLQGEWGPSVRQGVDIGEEIGDRFIITLRLVFAGMVLSFFFGILTGVISAVRQYSRTDHVLTFIGFLALAMPVFWLAALIKEWGNWANDQAGTRLFFTTWATSPGYYRMDFLEKVNDVGAHLVLPTLTLMLAGFALIGRYQRAQMLEVLNSDYVRLARAKGLRNRTVMRRHALRTALIPVATLFGIQIWVNLTGVVIVERVFEWRGLGRFLIDSVVSIDAYGVMGFLVISSVLITVGILVGDLLYAVLDPRIRYE